MIKLSEKELRIVKDILKNYASDYEVLVFGSRVAGNTHEYSDLDIAFKGTDKIDLLVLAAIKEEFQNSDIPFRVDVIDFNRISSEFQSIILKNYFRITFDWNESGILGKFGGKFGDGSWFSITDVI